MSDHQSNLPPQPAYIFRGHSTQIHALTFWRNNSRLISGDSEGWVVIWDMSIRRPTAVWRAHKSSILSLEPWDEDKLITHGRDESIRVWHITSDSERDVSNILPTESTEERKNPWLLHSLKAYTVSFCSISTCLERHPSTALLIATPSAKLGSTEIYSLPTEIKQHIVPPSTATGMKPSMAMALKLTYLNDKTLTLLSANESGFVTLQTFSQENNVWSTAYASKSHTQPILAIDIVTNLEYFYTSAADAVIAQYRLPNSADEQVTDDDRKIIRTGHAGQQDLKVRNDGKILATAGWDSRIRVYGCKSLGELAVLKWHKEAAYSIAFAHVFEEEEEGLKSTVSSRIEGSDGVVSAQGSQAVVSDTGADLTTRTGVVLTARQKREWKTKNTHWLAAGSKDGKISLWDIF